MKSTFAGYFNYFFAYSAMIKTVLLIVFIALSGKIFSQSLGHYPTSTITAGGNISISPNTAPSNTTAMQVFASAGFTGVVTAKAATGAVTVVNAKPVGTYAITVIAFNSSGVSTSKTFSLTVSKPRCSTGEFGSASMLNTGSQQIAVAIGDFNRDGKQDIAAAHEGGVNTISIRLGNGNGQFTGTAEIPVGTHPCNLVIGDFDRDGKQDIAVSCQGNNTVSICKGDGSGGFSSGTSISVDDGPVGIVTADFNEDGKQDLATVNLNSHDVSIRIGNGSGSFSGHTEVTVDSFPYAIVAADFNSDDHSDIATVSSTGFISVRFGTGAGQFTGNGKIAVGTFPYGLACGDFNEDGNQDLVSSNFVGNSLSVRLGDGIGNFSGSLELPVGNGAYSVTSGNLNGDGHLDLASVNYFDNTVSIRLGDGLGNFVSRPDIAVGSYPITIATGEFDNDKKQDIAVSNYNDHSVSILMGVSGIAPVASISTNAPVCLGRTIQLFADGDSIYSWAGPNNFSSADQNISIPSSTLSDVGIYSVTVTNSSNCSASASAYVNIYPLPFVSLLLSVDTFCYGSIETLIGGNPAGGIFSGAGVVNGNQFNTGMSGVGDITVNYNYTDVHGCTNTADHVLHVDLCSGLSNVEHEEIKLSPNPVKEFLDIQFKRETKNFNVEVYSVNGSLVLKSHDKSRIPMEDLNAGIYFVKISGRDFTRVDFIVKELY